VSQEVEISIIMPCLNESETLAACIGKAKDFLVRNNMNGEVVVGDNGSTDGSQEIAIKQGARLIIIKNKGYGAALLGAINEAKGRYIIMGDADNSYDFTRLMPFVDKLREGYDLVMGNRFKGGIKDGAMPILHRYLGNPMLTFLGQLFFNIPVGDFHCGLRSFSKASILSINLMTSGMEFASEMVVKAALFNLKITEVPTTLSPDGRSRSPHLKTWHDGWKHLRFLLMFSPKWLFLYPGLFGFILSTVFFCRLLLAPIHIGRIVLDLHSMIYFTSVIILSFQVILFYAMSKIYAVNQGIIPEPKNYRNLFRYFKLERGLIVGTLLVLAGLVILVLLLVKWKALGFGPITNITYTIKLSFLSMLFLVIGVQIIFSSFMLSILGIIQKQKYPQA